MMHTPGRQRARWISITGLLVVASVLLFVLSLTQSSYRVENQTVPQGRCIGLLLIGWMGVFGGIFAWLANPALLAAWILVWPRRSRPFALICAAAALALALSFLRQKEMDTDEAGNHAKIISYGTGYWIWIASISTMVLAGLWAFIKDWIGSASEVDVVPSAEV